MSLLLRGEELRCSNHKEADENPREEVGNLKKCCIFEAVTLTLLKLPSGRVLLLAHSSTPHSLFSVHARQLTEIPLGREHWL